MNSKNTFRPSDVVVGRLFLLRLYLSIFYLLFSSATLRAHRTKFSQNRPDRRKCVRFKNACPKFRVYPPHKNSCPKSPIFDVFRLLRNFSECGLKMYLQNLGIPPFKHPGPQTTYVRRFSTTSQLNGKFNCLYLRSEIQYRQSGRTLETTMGFCTISKFHELRFTNGLK